MIFDGKAFAEEIISKLPHKTCLPAGRKPKLAIFLDPNNVSGAKYVERKMKLAIRLGVEVVMNKIDGDETGIMVQLPHPNAKELIAQIPPEKDVDGLKEDSKFLPAAVHAVQTVLSAKCQVLGKTICIVGSKGFIGRKLMKVLGIRYSVFGMDKEDFDPEKIKEFDIVISATGQEGLIKDIKAGAVCIDLGFPKGDFDPKVAEKASFFTPVPGGVGPVTVACLFENLLA
jgi:methylenetetrahydrofolate dehydrogenase (NADP+)/methenyltetrahydrofolate cyclohydrolase